MAILDLFHAYVFGSALWYTIRAGCRIFDPAMVAGWFRPPFQGYLPPNDLELYNIRTDAWGLLTIAAMLVIVSGAVPLDLFISSSDKSAGPSASRTRAATASTATKAPYARAAIAADVAHHVLTGIGAWTHYSQPTHYNTAMAVGVWGCAGFAALGSTVLALGIGEDGKAGKVE